MGYGGKGYGYTQAGYGYGTSEFTGFDGLSIIPDTLGWWSVARRVLSRYNGPIIRLRRSSDSAEQDFYGIGPQGEVSTAELRAWNGWNLLGRTENFADASWVKTGLNTISASVETPPIAGIAVFSMTEDTSTGGHNVLQNFASFAASTQVTFSIYAKAAGRSVVVLRCAGSERTFTLTGSGSVSGGAGGSIQSLGNDWYRLSNTQTIPDTVLRDYTIRLNNGSGISYTGDGTSGILLGGVQLEAAASATTYETRSGAGAGSSFLVTLYEQAENGRNLLARTEEFEDSAWTKAGTSVSANTTINPVTGLTTADTLTEDTSTGAHTINATVPLVSGVTYTSSVYVKSNGRTSVSYRNDNDNATFIVNLTDGSVSSPVNCTATAIDAGGGWWRLVMTFTAIATGSRSCSLIRLRNGAGSTSYTGDGASGVFVWGAQLEVGTTATTYEKRTDRGAVRLDFAQSTTTLQPIICEQGVPVTENGRLAAKFVAADARRMSIASSTGLFNALHTTGGTILAVSRANDTAAAKALISNTSTSTGPGIRFISNSNENYVVSTGRLDVAGVATAGNSLSLASGVSSTSQTISVAIVDPDNAAAGSRAFYWGNGTQSVNANTQTGTPFIEASSENMTLGATSSGGGGSPYDGPISELALFSAAISTADRTAYQSRSGIFFTVPIS